MNNTNVKGVTMKTESVEILEQFHSELWKLSSTVLDELFALGETPTSVVTELDREEYQTIRVLMGTVMVCRLGRSNV